MFIRRQPLFVAVLALGATGAALAQGYGRTAEYTALPSGTVLKVRLDQRLNSAQARAGQRFTATARPDEDNSGLPVGTRVEGVVRDARSATKDQPGILDVDFTGMELPNGRNYPITGALTSLDANSVSHTANGRLVSKRSSKSDRMKFIGYGAGAGALVGLFSKGNLLKGTLLGAAGGYLYSQLNKDKARGGYANVDLKEGAEFGVRLDQEFAFSPVSNPSVDRYEEGLGRTDRSGVDLRNDRSGIDLRNDRDRSTSFRDRGSISVMMDGRAVSFSGARPMRAGTTVLVPLAPVMTAAGVRYLHNPVSREITVNSDQGEVRGSVGSEVAWATGERVLLAEPIRMSGGTLYVPAAFLELALGRRTSWNEANQTLRLSPAGTYRHRDRRDRNPGF